MIGNFKACVINLGRDRLLSLKRVWISLPAILFFSKSSDFVTRCMAKEGTHRIINYLDDLCLLGSSVEEVNNSQLKLIRILRSLGFKKKLIIR